MSSARIVTGGGHSRLHTVVRHLWLPLIESGLGRVVVGRHSEPGWHALHTFTLQPLRNRPRLLVSTGPKRALARSLSSYRHLRTPTAQVGRLLTAGKVASGWQRAGNTVSVETQNPAGAMNVEPISVMQRIIGEPLLALVGIRDSANGKATLQLFARTGQPMCYAKLAWNAHTATYVRTEAAALRAVSFARSHTYVPQLVSEGTIGDELPYLMTEPLPSSVRKITDSDLSPTDVAGLFPIVRHGTLRDSGQFQAVVLRLEAASSLLKDEELGSLTSQLVAALSRLGLQLPILQRWHGDLVPWNAAVDDDGGFWLWDWESSDEDAIGGLDILHWLLNSAEPAEDASFVTRLQAASTKANEAMRFLDMGEDHRSIATAAYALTFAERNWNLAATNGGWSRHRIGRDATVELLKFGLSQVVT